MVNERVEILFESSEVEALRRQAKKAKKSVGALIREAALRRLLSAECQIKFPPWKKLKKEIEDSLGRNSVAD
jgi:hypothetical protein